MRQTLSLDDLSDYQKKNSDLKKIFDAKDSAKSDGYSFFLKKDDPGPKLVDVVLGSRHAHGGPAYLRNRFYRPAGHQI